MAYEPKTWERGEVISADALNHIERGIAEAGGGALIVHVDEEGVTDKTWQEIHDALANGIPTYVAYSFTDDSSTTAKIYSTSLFPALAAEQAVEIKSGTSRFRVLLVDGMTLTGLLADGYLHIS